MPLRFLIDENLTPMLASWLTGTLGFDAVHVNDVGLRGASDPAVLAYAVAERRVVMTSNADDFRKLMRAVPGHPGLAIVLDAVGRRRQVELGALLAAAIAAAGLANGQLFEIDAVGCVRTYRLP